MSAPVTLPVSTGSASYEVVVGEGLLDTSGMHVSRLSDARACALVTDENIRPLFGARVTGSLRDAGLEVTEVVVPAGERSKSWAAAGSLLERLARAGLERTDLVVALGGGVIGDLAGFCAAVYLRGVDYVQLPTTLLAQVDSSVGGKTGVDLEAGKNLAGAFKQPLVVLADTQTLGTLAPVEWQSGLAEVAKAAMLAGPEQLEWMTRHADSLVAREASAVREAVLRAVRHKIDVVSADEREAGVRESLNYGHTLGHAIEQVAGYGVVPHGIAVAEGMRFAARLASRLLGAPADSGEAQERMLDSLGIERPTYPGDVDALVRAMHADKKARSGTVRFALVPEPGTFVAVPVADEVLVGELRRWIDDSEEGR